MNTDSNTITISEKFLLGDLIKVVMQEIRTMPFSWGVLPEKDQPELLPAE